MTVTNIKRLRRKFRGIAGSLFSGTGCFLAVSLFVLASCEKNIDFTGSVPDPLVVVNSFIESDSVLTAHISKSKFFLDQGEPQTVHNAKVSVFINDEPKGYMRYDGSGYYLIDYKGSPKDRIRYSVEIAGMPVALCEAQLPARANIVSIDTTGVTVATDTVYDYGYGSAWQEPDTLCITYRINYRFRLNFTDPAGERNYYRLQVYRSASRYEMYGKYYEDDFVFDDIVAESSQGLSLSEIGSESASKTYGVFSDELFDGKEYPLTFTVSANRYSFFEGKEPDEPEYDRIHINLQTISRDFYLYLKTREAAEGVVMDLFSEPVQIHNNIENGIGILGTCTGNLKTVEIK